MKAEAGTPARPLRVVHVGPSTSSGGGMGACISQLVALSGPDLLASAAPTWWRGRPLRSWFGVVTFLLKLLGGLRCDVVHVHLSERGSFVREGLLVVTVRLVRTPVVATLHGADFADSATRYRPLVSYVLRHCDGIICLGPQTERIVSKLAPAVSTYVLPNFVEGSRLPAAVNDSRKLSVLFAGVVGYRKGFDRLAAAWKKVRSEVPDAELIACGAIEQGYQPPKLEGLNYRGLLTPLELAAEYERASVACLPSRREVMPMFILEALSQGVPVVATAVGEFTSFGECPAISWITVEDVPESDIVDTLASHLVSHLQDIESFRSEAQIAQIWVDRHFSAAVTRRRILQIYSDAAAHGKSLRQRS